MEPWIIQAGVGLLIAIVAWFIKRELVGIRTDLSGLCSRMNAYNTRLSHIEGKLGLSIVGDLDEPN